MSEYPQLVHEVWQMPDGCTSLVKAGPKGEAARQMFESGAELKTTFLADSHFEAMTLYYEFVNEHLGMKWGTYSTDDDWAYETYPLE